MHTRLLSQLQRLLRVRGKSVGSARAQGCAGRRYLFLTLKERNGETGLDYLINRYYSSTQGRFTSVDPENAGSYSGNPQTWNGYSYALNQPMLYSDPDGLTVKICGTDGQFIDKDTHLTDAEFDKRLVAGKTSRLRMERFFRMANKSERMSGSAAMGACTMFTPLLEEWKQPIWDEGLFKFMGPRLSLWLPSRVLRPDT